MSQIIIHDPKELVCLFGYLKEGYSISMKILEDIGGEPHYILFIEGVDDANA